MMMRFWDEQTAYQTYVSFGFEGGSTMDLKIKTIEFSGKRVRTELSDNAGLTPTDTHANQVYKKASAVVVCYSHRSMNSFEAAQRWLEHGWKYAWMTRTDGVGERLKRWCPDRCLLVATDHVEEVKLEGKTHSQVYVEGGWSVKEVKNELMRESHQIWQTEEILDLIIAYLPSESLRRVGVSEGRKLANEYDVGFCEVKLNDEKKVARIFNQLIQTAISTDITADNDETHHHSTHHEALSTDNTDDTDHSETVTSPTTVDRGSIPTSDPYSAASHQASSSVAPRSVSAAS